MQNNTQSNNSVQTQIVQTWRAASVAVISILITYTLLLTTPLHSQTVVIDDDDTYTAASAMLQVEAGTGNKGFLLPRIAYANRPANAAANDGLLYYFTDGDGTNGAGFYYYEHATTSWEKLGTFNSGWSTIGNTGTTVGTNFLGTTDDEDFAFYSNDTERMRIIGQAGSNLGFVNIGTGTDTIPSYPLDITGSLSITTSPVHFIPFTANDTVCVKAYLTSVTTNKALPIDTDSSSTHPGSGTWIAGDFLCNTTASTSGTMIGLRSIAHDSKNAGNSYAKTYGLSTEATGGISAFGVSAKAIAVSNDRFTAPTIKAYGGSFEADIPNWGPGGGVASVYGVKAKATTGATALGNAYGLYAEASGGSSNSYAVYADGSAATYAGYFEGRVGILGTSFLSFTNVGAVAPTVTTRSAGTKIVLYQSLSGTLVDYALGIDGNTLWYSIPGNTSTYAHKFYGKTSELMRIRGDGNVGIGQASPAQRLDVNGNIRMSANRSKIIFQGDNSTTQSGGLGLHSTLSGGSIYILPTNSAGTYTTPSTIYLGSTGAFTTQTTHLNVNGNATLGIGDGGAQLTCDGLNGDFSITDGRILSTTSATMFINWSPRRNLNINQGYMTLSSTGNLFVFGTASKTAGTTWAVTSDKRIKTDILDIENSIETLMKLRPIKYKYTDEWKKRNSSIKDHYYYSFIAQEYQEVFPESVQGSGHYLEGDDVEILQIEIDNAQIVTIKAVQELVNQNQNQNQIINTLENKIAALEAEKIEMKKKTESLEASVKEIKELLMVGEK